MACTATNSEKLSQIYRTVSGQVKSTISKALAKIQKTLFKANYLVDFNETKCSHLVDMYCNKNNEQLLQAKLCLGICNQIFTKTLTKRLTPENTDRSKILDAFKFQ